MRIDHDRLEYSTEYVVLAMFKVMHDNPIESDLYKAASNVTRAIFDMDDLVNKQDEELDEHNRAIVEAELERILGQNTTQ